MSVSPMLMGSPLMPSSIQPDEEKKMKAKVSFLLLIVFLKYIRRTFACLLEKEQAYCFVVLFNI